MFHVISDKALRDSKLTPNSKLLLQLITSLANGPYGCIAKNSYFMKALNVKSDKSIRNYLTELRNNEYIESENLKRGTSRIPIRTITPVFDNLPKIKEKVNAILKKDHDNKNEAWEPDWLQEIMDEF